MAIDEAHAAGPVCGPIGSTRNETRRDLVRAWDAVRAAARLRSEDIITESLAALSDRLSLIAHTAGRQEGDDVRGDAWQYAAGLAFALDDAHPDIVRAINDVGVSGLATGALTEAAKALDAADAACAPLVDSEREHPHDGCYPDWDGTTTRHHDGAATARPRAAAPAPSLSADEIAGIEI